VGTWHWPQRLPSYGLDVDGGTDGGLGSFAGAVPGIAGVGLDGVDAGGEGLPEGLAFFGMAAGAVHAGVCRVFAQYCA
jgi:hypothetical protein